MSIEITNREIVDNENVTSQLAREWQMIHNSYETPFRAYARWLMRQEAINPMRALTIKENLPVGVLWKAEIAYRKIGMKNYVGQTTGSQGSGKSLATMRLAMDYDPDWCTHNKGSVDLPKIFWSYEKLLEYVRTEAKKGDCLVLDSNITLANGSIVSLRDLWDIQRSVKRLVRFPLKTFNITKRVFENGAGWIRSVGNRKTRKVRFDDGTENVVTLGQKILTNRGYVEVKDLKVGDMVVSE